MKNENMSKSPSLKINILLNMFYQVLTVITPLITAPYISRVLQADGVGINSYTASLLTIFTLFAALGTASYGKKIIAGFRDDIKSYSKAFWEIELITLFTTSIFLVAWVIFALLYVSYRPYMLVLSFTLLATLFDISWLYGGLERFQYAVFVNATYKVTSVFFIFMLVKTKNDLLMYTAITSISTLLGTASMWLFLPKYIIKVHIDLSSLKQHFKSTVVYFGPSIATSIYTVLDKTLIGIITRSDLQNGYYEQATKIISIVKSICFDAINVVMMARASFIFSQNDEKKLSDICDTTYHLTSLLSVAACFGIIGVSKTFVPVFFGEGYIPVVVLLDILAVVVIVIGISSVANTIYYFAGGHMRNATKLILIGSGTNLILNIALIPFLGSYGAAIATLIAESIITILFINGTNGFIKWIDIIRFFGKKLCSGLIMLITILILDRNMLNINNYVKLATEIMTGAIVYIIILIILKDSSILLGKEYIAKIIIKRGDFNG